MAPKELNHNKSAFNTKLTSTLYFKNTYGTRRYPTTKARSLQNKPMKASDANHRKRKTKVNN